MSTSSERILRLSKALLVVAALVLCGLGFWLFRMGPEVTIVVPKGASAWEMGRLLKREGVIESETLFRVLAKLTGVDRDLKPGKYVLRKSMASLEALLVLRRGCLSYIRIVIPEGFKAAQIAARLAEAGVTNEKEFLDYVLRNRLEGYLFPTTYFMEAGMPPYRVARVMREEFSRQVNPHLKSEINPMPLGAVVVLASIVEREVTLAHEKPLVVRVYLNRLEKGWRLEADPTVQYALGYWKKNLRYRDLHVQSPYNTYLHYGLPPGPICSPGLDSIKAVLNPVQSKAMYFVADGKGGHSFHTSFKDHVAAKKKYKQVLRESRRKKK